MTNDLPNRIKIFILIVTFGFVLLGLSCSNEPDATFVDFSKKVDVSHSETHPTVDKYLKVAVAAMISAQETAVHYHQILEYLAGKVGRKIQLVQRKTYSEINELIGKGDIDLAFICSGPYILGREKYHFEALAMPEVRGSPLYQSYLIVNEDSHYHQLSDLKDKVFAFTDPESNSGYLVPNYWLFEQGTTAEDFFKKTIYTYSHDNSIKAVTLSLVDGAAVHGQIWEYFNTRNPEFTSKTRIIKKSIPFGNPPVVASSNLSEPTKQLIRKLLLTMHQDPQGKKILNELMIDRFILPQNIYYDPILKMKAAMG